MNTSHGREGEGSAAAALHARVTAMLMLVERCKIEKERDV
jgi:hypothetical protein